MEFLLLLVVLENLRAIANSVEERGYVLHGKLVLFLNEIGPFDFVPISILFRCFLKILFFLS